MTRVLSMNFDGTYVIKVVRDLRDADQIANRNVNQLHFVECRSGVLQWVGEHVDSTFWYTPTNPEQAKKAQLLLLLEPT